jgi:hypothetical protein
VPSAAELACCIDAGYAGSPDLLCRIVERQKMTVPLTALCHRWPPTPDPDRGAGGQAAASLHCAGRVDGVPQGSGRVVPAHPGA